MDGTPCCTYIGPDGAGHYVKMVHNGIEYADMQLIAEAYDLLRHGAGLEVAEIASTFDEWNRGDLESFLIEITAKVLAKEDAATGGPLVDVIVDQAEQKGTGRWTSQDALELGVPLTGITEAVFARSLSSLRDERAAASQALAGPRPGERAADDDARRRHPRGALRQQGGRLRAGVRADGRRLARPYDWELDMGALATIWRGGCIIRARFLDRIREAYAENPDSANLLLMPYFRDAVADAQDALAARHRARRSSSASPVPAFSSSLAYYDGYRRERGPANLIQGLRDFFGAHTYKRDGPRGRLPHPLGAGRRGGRRRLAGLHVAEAVRVGPDVLGHDGVAAAIACRGCSPPTPPASTPTTRCPASRSASGRSPRRREGGRR